MMANHDIIKINVAQVQQEHISPLIIYFFLFLAIAFMNCTLHCEGAQQAGQDCSRTC